MQNIGDISMNKLFSDTQTCGYSKNLKKPRALKTFRMNLFCVRRQSTNGSSFPGDIVHSKTLGLRQVSEYSDIHGILQENQVRIFVTAEIIGS